LIAQRTDVVFERDPCRAFDFDAPFEVAPHVAEFLADRLDEIFDVRPHDRELPADRLDESDC
jgi:hypothetical protein